ncbi:ATP-dependent helicase HrpB [Corynebacterium alimapuense]|uniref:ATP-dependent helicase HrpB n=1 Tax=Corynebacterium alimapuense TaxID=1576874 RepID=A0A3M8K6Q8_9CORY|nr:ATP-dependent helicase HrpB [Corynebacterium alimapuense]RNE48194.1 ATP-dependent helicase HrpB [Corynebacterium alimapuense]
MFDLSRIGQGLPVAETIDQLPKLLARNQRAVIQAPPGTGKTTLIPPALANFTGGKVLVTAPRRVAVRAAARRLAQLDGSRIGERVGFSVRGEHHPGSRVEFMTPGVLLRRLMSDPELTGIQAVAIDEVHERQLDTDLVLGMILELAELREDLVVTAMSATLDVDKFAGLMDAPVLDTPAVIYPLMIEYAPHEGRLGCTPAFLDHLALQARKACREHSVLVFVPGVREVEHVVSRIPGALALHGSLNSSEQDAALRPSDSPRVIVATSIAESSLTVPGVRVVVDSGLSRVPRRDAARHMTGLVTVSAAGSTVDQRAGRAGREGPGTVIRCYSEHDYRHLPAHISPEIATSDLTQAALTLAVWGTPRGAELPFVDAPPSLALDAAEEVLRGIGAISEAGHATDLGRQLARMPLDPRLGRALLTCGPNAAEVIACLADSPRGDISAQLRTLRGQPSFKREVTRLRRLAGSASGTSDPGVITALAFPGWVARTTGEEYLLASGTRAVLPPNSSLRGAEWLAVAEVTRVGYSSREGRAGATIRAAARLSEQQAREVVGVTEEVRARVDNGKVKGLKVTGIGAIVLSYTPVKVPPEQAAEALANTIREHGLEMFRFSDKARSLRERLSFLHSRLGDPWPDPTAADPASWLGPELDAMAHGTSAERVDMYPALQRILPWPEATRMEELAPERLQVPSGNRHRIAYDTGRPVVSVKLQECFGLAGSPELAGVPVLFHLLSPAGRPLAVTDDLASFWSGPYAQVRAEMRGRYPRHPWPEDPWSAKATARTKNRM